MWLVGEHVEALHAQREVRAATSRGHRRMLSRPARPAGPAPARYCWKIWSTGTTRMFSAGTRSGSVAITSSSSSTSLGFSVA